MKSRHLGALSIVALLGVAANLSFSTRIDAAESAQMKDDLEQLAMDLHVGIDRSTLTDPQKAQLKDDFRELKQAHQNHQMFAAIRALRSIRAMLDSGAFKPADQKRIKEDIQALREAREEGGGSRL
jgi:Spy/CpxP family protein refolding chaperone